jgi:hypothetical protein
MEHSKHATETAIGPADRPDDPLLNRPRTPVHVPPDAAPSTRPDATTKPTAPTPDQEGCYFLG